MSPFKPSRQDKFVPYRVLAILLYPIRHKFISAPSWNKREFYQRALADTCQITPSMLRGYLDNLLQAGFLLSVEHHKEPGKYGKLWSECTIRMPDGANEMNEQDHPKGEDQSEARGQ